ncbi:TPA: hypothetical protein ACHSDM_005772 [Pseudomonas aeruginosa]|uniref:hypothetical protein n=1 Tax=Pseudomonas aeruginosa TaxID=287 RepID=UPI000738C99C|nr:hypothetical protein [Pseudomonas aeruginosa]ALU49776.1 hypothetical protein AU380_18960 [Pseudomonas aeruginosa]MDT8141921.1 hypothetical protein [Pseudomonas aeruginosa]MEC6385580.1 hypothetical protein [Pseudomonas aeruginosa]
MGRPEELDDLFDEATGTPREAKSGHSLLKLVALPEVAPPLRPLLNESLPALVQALVEQERRRSLVRRVDGLIIGTGEADFTKGNTAYTLNYKDKTFQLLDVPGIEGDEAKYVDDVCEAVAKAHLVFYVNGTNKKPEKATAEKIRSYLRWGTQVCPLVNVRGSADAYEFPEDREALERHGGAASALKQTLEVLGPVLGPEVLMPGQCVQGLLAFSSLAFHSASGETSIHPCRDRDLVIQQRNYLKHFESLKAMYEFSQIKAVARVLHGKLATFQQDIVESNKAKVSGLLSGYLAVLHEQQQEHRVFLARVAPEFEKCRVAFKEAMKTFERMSLTGRENAWNELFNELTSDADEIVAEHLGDADHIKSAINQAFKKRQFVTGERLQEHFDKNIGKLMESLQQAMTRLLEDVQRVEFQQRVSFNTDRRWNLDDGIDLSHGLGLGDFSSMVLQIGTYAFTGGTIGSAFPVIGTAIGVAVGAAVGVLLGLLNLMLGRDKRVRAAQGKVRESIESVRNQLLSDLPAEVRALVTSIKKEINDGMLAQVDRLHESLLRPLSILEQQIALMNKLKGQLEKMPYGTIHAVQC